MSTPTTMGEPRPCLGREVEKTRLAELFASERLITLIGPPGAGKTELASRFADRTKEERFVAWVDLTHARAGDEAMTSVAASLGVTLGATLDGDDTCAIGEALDGRGPVLLVLDACDRLTRPIADALVSWLHAAPRARFLLTSREALRLRAERRFVVEPLDPAAAVALLTRGARARDASFDPASVSEGLLAAIVDRLGRHPLAIGLAAARMGELSAAALSDHLSTHLPPVAHDSGDADQRRRVARAAILWSWELLSEDEQTACAELSVFRGGFTPEGAEAVLSSSRPTEDLLRSLQEAAWLRLVGEEGQPRFDLHESLRAHAAEQLDRREGSGGAARRHAGFYRARVRHWSQTVMGPDGSAIVAAIIVELPNLTKVYHRSRKPDPATALEVLVATWPVVALHGGYDRFADRLGEVMRQPNLPVELSTSASLVRCEALHLAGRPLEAFAELEAIAPESLAPALAAERERIRGELLCATGQPREAGRAFEAAAAVHRQRDDQGRAAFLLGRLAHAQALAMEPAAARESCARALALAARHGNRSQEAMILSDFALAELLCGDFTAAQKHFAGAIAIHREFGDRFSAGRAALGSGAAYLTESIDERAGDAEERFAEAIASARMAGDRWTRAASLGHLGILAAHREEIARAHLHLEDAMALAEALGDPHLMGALHLAGATLDAARAQIATRRGDAEAAAAAWREAGARLTFSADDEVVSRSLPVLMVRLLVAKLVTPAAYAPDPARVHRQLTVAADGAWFVAPNGERRELAHRPTLRRIVGHLVTRRLEEPGSRATREELHAIAWPGERMRPDSGAKRVYVALSTLRRMGLRGLLLTRGGGYFIDSEVEVVEVPQVS